MSMMGKMKLSRAAGLLAAFCLVIVSLAVPRITALADGASLEMTQDKSEASQGDTVTVSVVINSGSEDVKLGDGTVFTLTYDPNVLTFTDSSGYTFQGSIYWGTGPVDSSIFRENFTFQVTGQGDTDVRLASGTVIKNMAGEDLPYVVNGPDALHVHVEGVAVPTESVNPGEPSSEIPTFSPEDLGVADLKALDVSPGAIVFDPNVTEYTLDVAQDVTRVGVTAVTADPAATYVVEGYDQLVTGENLVTIRVTAQDGTVKDYVIHVIRASENSEPVSTQESKEAGSTVDGFPLEVKASQWYVTTYPKNLEIPAGFTKNKLRIDNYEFSAYRCNANPDLYLIYAGQNGADPSLAYYRLSDSSIFPYVDLNAGNTGSSRLPHWLIGVLAGIIVALIAALVILLARRSPNRRTGGDRSGQGASYRRPAPEKPAEKKPVRNTAKSTAERKPAKSQTERAAAPAAAAVTGLGASAAASRIADEESLYEDKPARPEKPVPQREFDVFKPLYGAAPKLPEDDEFEEDFDDEEDEEELFGYREANKASDQSREYRGGDRKAGAQMAQTAPRMKVEELGEPQEPSVDLSAIQKGLEREVSRMSGPGTAAPARQSRPSKPAVSTHRLNEATTRIDSDVVKGNRGN